MEEYSFNNFNIINNNINEDIEIIENKCIKKNIPLFFLEGMPNNEKKYKILCNTYVGYLNQQKEKGSITKEEIEDLKIYG